MSDRVRIRYDKDVGDYKAGSTFTVVSPEAAEELHPQARILGYVGGRKYVKPKVEQAADDDDKKAAPKSAKTAKAANGDKG